MAEDKMDNSEHAIPLGIPVSASAIPGLPNPTTSLPHVIRYLQQEWQRFESERGRWHLEKLSLKHEIATLHGKLQGKERLSEMLTRRIRMLEYALREERAKVPVVDGAVASVVVSAPTSENSPTPETSINMKEELQNTTTTTIVTTTTDNNGSVDEEKESPSNGEVALVSSSESSTGKETGIIGSPLAVATNGELRLPTAEDISSRRKSIRATYTKSRMILRHYLQELGVSSEASEGGSSGGGIGAHAGAGAEFLQKMFAAPPSPLSNESAASPTATSALLDRAMNFQSTTVASTEEKSTNVSRSSSNGRGNISSNSSSSRGSGSNFMDTFMNDAKKSTDTSKRHTLTGDDATAASLAARLSTMSSSSSKKRKNMTMGGLGLGGGSDLGALAALQDGGDSVSSGGGGSGTSGAPKKSRSKSDPSKPIPLGTAPAYKPRLTVASHTGEVFDADWVSDSAPSGTLATAGGDGVVLLWPQLDIKKKKSKKKTPGASSSSNRTNPAAVLHLHSSSAVTRMAVVKVADPVTAFGGLFSQDATASPVPFKLYNSPEALRAPTAVHPISKDVVVACCADGWVSISGIPSLPDESEPASPLVAGVARPFLIASFKAHSAPIWGLSTAVVEGTTDEICLVTASNDGKCKVWNVSKERGIELLVDGLPTGSPALPTSVALLTHIPDDISPITRIVAVGHADGSVGLVNGSSGGEWKVVGTFRGVARKPDSTGGEEEEMPPSLPATAITSLASHESRLLASDASGRILGCTSVFQALGIMEDDDSKSVALSWNKVSQAHTSGVIIGRISISDDGVWAATGDSRGSIRVWDPESLDCLLEHATQHRQYNGSATTWVGFSKGRHVLASAGADAIIKAFIQGKSKKD